LFFQLDRAVSEEKKAQEEVLRIEDGIKKHRFVCLVGYRISYSNT
jgi:hypothetical protein